MIQTMAIDSDFKVKVDSSISFSSAEEAKVDEIWSEAIRQNQCLFDAPIITVVHATSAVLHCACINYKFFYTNHKGDIAFNKKIEVAAVSGIALFEGQALFGKRSKSVTQQPGKYELVPSGGLPWRGENEVDYRVHLIEELHEEAQLVWSNVVSCEPFLLVQDRDDNVYDICCVIQLNSVVGGNFSDNQEYEDLKFGSVVDLRRFANSTPSAWVPTSAAILRELPSSVLSEL